MDKNVVLSNEELELLITGLHCVDERSYNFYTTTYTPWSEAKELKENLRIKLKRVLLNRVSSSVFQFLVSKTM